MCKAMSDFTPRNDTEDYLPGQEPDCTIDVTSEDFTINCITDIGHEISEEDSETYGIVEFKQTKDDVRTRMHAHRFLTKAKSQTRAQKVLFAFVQAFFVHTHNTFYPILLGEPYVNYQ